MQKDQKHYINITLCHEYVSDACSGKGWPV